MRALGKLRFVLQGKYADQMPGDESAGHKTKLVRNGTEAEEAAWNEVCNRNEEEPANKNSSILSWNRHIQQNSDRGGVH